jgi:hypothetical protein
MHRFQRWRDALQVAPNVTAVARIMNDYVDAIRPQLTVLPAHCQSALSAPVDVQSAAVTLLHAELDFRGPAETTSFLHEVAHTFASASVRVTMLHTKPSAPSD